MNKPIWTTGKILWTENYDDPDSETFAEAWLRLFGEEICYWNEDLLDQFFDDDGRFILAPKGRVLYFTITGGNIQLDPTYNKNMFKNIQVDPSITYTNSLYVFLFGSLDQGQKCDEFDSILIKYLKEIEAIGVKVYLKNFSRNCKFQYQTIGTSDDCKRVDALMDNCASELKELNNRPKFKQLFDTVKNRFKGSFNNPTLAQADALPLVLPVKEMKPAISEEKIVNASNSHSIKPLIKVRSTGILAWLRGSFNNPIDLESELEKIQKKLNLNYSLSDRELGSMNKKDYNDLVEENRQLEKQASKLRGQIANSRSKNSARAAN